MKNKEYLNIYWAPLSDQENNDWSLMYSEPVTLFSYMSKNKIESKADKFFSCPAVKGLTQNTYIFTNTIESEYLYDFSDVLFQESLTLVDGLGRIIVKCNYGLTLVQ